MKAIRVRVENGHITGEAPGLPDGELELCVADAGDDMSDDEIARLNRALEAGFASIEARRFRPAADVLDELRRG